MKVRSDSAAYQQETSDWDKRGWYFAVRADMSHQLREAVEALPPEAWQMWYTEKDGMIREWPDVCGYG